MHINFTWSVMTIGVMCNKWHVMVLHIFPKVHGVNTTNYTEVLARTDRSDGITCSSRTPINLTLFRSDRPRIFMILFPPQHMNCFSWIHGLIRLQCSRKRDQSAVTKYQRPVDGEYEQKSTDGDRQSLSKSQREYWINYFSFSLNISEKYRFVSL